MADHTEVRLSIDTSQWEKLVKNLTGKEVYRSIQRGFRKSALMLRKGIQKEVQASTNPHREGVKTWTKRGYFYAKPLHKDVKISVFRTALGANVSLCNPKNPNNRAYVLRYLNKGSGKRATKKGINRGSLRALNFFEKGIDATKDRAIAELDENIRIAVMKQVNKYN